MDDFVVESCLNGGIRQVVNLGAGMDTRAVRLNFPEGVTFFELDKLPLLQIKEPLLQPMLQSEERSLCSRIVIPVDFENPPEKYRGKPEAYWGDLLIAEGFDSSAPSCWVLEGLTYYLPATANQAIFQQISKMSAPGSTVVFDMVNGNFMKQGVGGWHLNDLAARGCPWKWGHNNPAALLAPLGFKASVLDLRNLEVSRARRKLIIHPPVEKNVAQSREALTLYVTAVQEGTPQ
jgi:methyltransferase (TIGR00027 family)